jgi:DcmR-like sensory protein
VKRIAQPISIAGSEMGEFRHVCAFFSDDDEEYRVLLPFIRDGLASGQRAIHIINSEQRQEHLERLAAEGIETATCQQSGQLEVGNSTELYLQDGRFDQDRMLAAFKDLASGGKAAGRYPLSRIICRMDWAFADQAYIRDVIEFESRVNDVWRVHDDAVICTYRLSKLSGDAVIDILQTHPLVIIGSLLHQNPFFTPPEEFLPEYRRRHGGRQVRD